MNAFRRCIALVASVALVATTMPLRAQPAAPAPGLIGTEQVAAMQASAAPSTGDAQARLREALSRPDLAAALAERGVGAAQVEARIASLTDAEAAELLARIDSAPAGADVLGLLFTVFVILLVTDILGFTKVFPFTRSVR